MSEFDANTPEGEPEITDLRAEGVAASRAPRTLFGSVALFAPAAYAAAVVLRDSPHPMWLRLLVGVAGLGTVGLVSARIDDLAPEGRMSGRLTLGAGVVAATLSAGHPGDSASTIARIAIVLASTLAAASAGVFGTHVAGLGGVGAVTTRESRALLFGWSLTGVAFTASLLPRAHFEWARLPLAAIVATAAVIHLLAIARRRRHELGARERYDLLLGGAALSLPLAAAVATGLSPFSSFPRAEAALSLPALCLSAAVLVAQLARDPVAAAARVGRAWVVLVAAVVAAVALVLWSPSSALGGLVIGVLVGLFVDALSRALGLEGPRTGSVRAALLRARDAATTSDPNEVARGVLTSVRVLSGAPLDRPGTPRLLLFSPLREVSLDAAGEARTRSPLPSEQPFPDPDAPSPIARVVPPELLSLAVSEPLGVVRASALRSVEVRRPDLRPALRFLDGRDASAAVAVLVDGELEALLLVPDAEHSRELGLFEVRALRTIARLCATRLSLEAALARASARAQRAEQRARDLEHVVERADHDRERLLSSIGAAARPLERPIASSGYAPASRALLAELDALAPSAEHFVLVHRPGTDPLPFLARLHQKSGRKGTLQVVDAGRREGADVARWADPSSSPVELSRDGTLAVLAPQALPREAQRRLISALAFREGPSADPSPVDLRLVLSIVSTDPEHDDLARLFEVLDPSLAAHLRRAPVRVLPLSRRIEDLHASCLDRLAALGTSLAGRPLGLAPEAFALLVEHPWPGDDLELDDVLSRAALSAVSSSPTSARIEARHVAPLLGPAHVHP